MTWQPRLRSSQGKLNRGRDASLWGCPTWPGFLFGWILISKYLILMDGTGWVVHACVL
jgi:hypothetical protein